jgi:serine protein kinase
MNIVDRRPNPKGKSLSFDPVTLGSELEKHYGIPLRRLTGTISPWAVKRLEEFEGDITKFTVVRLQPSRLKQIFVATTKLEDGSRQNDFMAVFAQKRTALHPPARDGPVR